MNRRHPSLFVTLIFAGLLLGAGGVQWGMALLQGEPPAVLDIFKAPPTVANLRAYEERLEAESVVARWLRPWMQYAQFVLFKNTGEKALVGREGWFFYRPGVEYHTQRQSARAPEDDPESAICDFRDQLAARGIHLLVVPAPNKESIYPEQLSPRAAHLTNTLCAPTRSLLERLRSADVEVLDLFEVFSRHKAARPRGSGEPLYLAQDSHWSPAGLKRAAQAVAQRLRERGWIAPGTTAFGQQIVHLARRGDVVRMLNMPPLEARLPAEQVDCTRVVLARSGEPYRDDPQAAILVLGDSFLRIFQQDEPGAAGFIAHLASELRQPVASIVNDGGASTLVRQELHRRPELLRHTKVVVWEFVERDIRFGLEGWQKVPLPGGAAEMVLQEKNGGRFPNRNPSASGSR